MKAPKFVNTYGVVTNPEYPAVVQVVLGYVAAQGTQMPRADPKVFAMHLADARGFCDALTKALADLDDPPPAAPLRVFPKSGH